MNLSLVRHEIYSHSDLHRVLAPRSVAVVGVSVSADSIGSKTLSKIEQAGFGGSIFIVNPKYSELRGRPCYPSISSLPQMPDCVVIAVPREFVESIVAECASRRVGGVIVFSSGYAETGLKDRERQQERLLATCRHADMRLLGPNCLGLLNYTTGFHASFGISPLAAPPHAAAIGLISQSGGLAFSLAQAVERGVAFSHVLTMGNSSDVDAADLISYLAEEPSCRAIACLIEGMANPRRLLEAARIAAAAGKPIVACKLATGGLGAAAALSHTGSLAGSNAAYLAAFRRSGVVVVNNYEALIETATFFAKAGQPKSSGVGALATSGGACVMLADMAELHGVTLPTPGPATQEALKRVIPEFGSVGNPCDLTGQMQRLEPLAECIDAFMADDTYGAVVFPQPHASDVTRARLRVLSGAADRYRKIACSVWLPEWLEGPGAMETERDPHVALFRSADRCMFALRAWHEREQWRQSQPRALRRVVPEAQRPIAAGILAAADKEVMTERESKEALAVYGLPVVGERLVGSVEAAVSAASAMGYPVVLKVESADLPHKTEAGVIRLNLRDEAQVRAGYAAILTNAEKILSPSRINGVLVQPMVAEGLELMIGARVDPLFGPMVVVGLGGTLVELLKDAVTDLAPISHDEADSMLRRLKGAALLNGFRGSPPVNRTRVADVIVRLSEFVSDQRDQVREIDINPLICSADRVIAVDALIALSPGGSP